MLYLGWGGWVLGDPPKASVSFLPKYSSGVGEPESQSGGMGEQRALPPKEPSRPAAVALTRLEVSPVSRLSF